MVGGSGTAKTTTALMYFDTLKNDSMLVKRINFSSATTSGMFQASSPYIMQGGGGGGTAVISEPSPGTHKEHSRVRFFFSRSTVGANERRLLCQRHSYQFQTLTNFHNRGTGCLKENLGHPTDTRRRVVRS